MNRRISSILAVGVAALAPVLAVACGDSPTDIGAPNLHVIISTEGVDKDADGYLLYGTGEPVRLVRTDGELLLAVPAGEYAITIDGIAGNCSLQSPATVSTMVEAAGTATAAFRLECRAVSGSIEVAATTTGRDFDADGYAVKVDGSPRGTVFSNSAALVEGLSAGAHTVSLDGFSENCGVSAGSGSVDVQLSIGALTRDVRRVAFEIICQATTGDVRVTTTTLGSARDPNGYTLMLDDSLFQVPTCPEADAAFFCPGAPLRLAGTDSHLVTSLVPGDHTVELRDVHGSCRVEGSNRRIASVAVGGVAEVVFSLVCGTP
jgi:hypothetical protein